MQLNRKTTGDYKSDRNFIGQDLDTLQRTITQIQQTLAAQQTTITALQTQLASPNLSISASGQVANASSAALKTVTHDWTLVGQGTPTVPLSVSAAFSAAVTPVTVTISDSELRALNTVPKVILPAQGANTLTFCLGWQLAYKLNSVFSANPSLNVRFTGGAVSGITAQVVTLTGATGIRLANSAMITAGNNAIATGIENTAVEIFSNTALTGGATRGGMQFRLVYIVLVAP